MLLVKAKSFVKEVVDEAKKLEVPTKEEFKKTFTTIVIMIVMASISMTLIDLLISFILRIVFGLEK